ncbi:MAG: nicotinamide-nucleotide adenylyltransferase [Candidatus Bathyarchaeota archaeon]|jgi:nicotinamide-nucleotide adenylyltransferase|nr:nicotinamide-nucleotide adenylyltransferase [Candidatus Bathyarchaeota archaeon]
MTTRGLYVGRFQPFHLGHLHAIKYILSEVDEVVIVIGSGQYSHQLNNPFTAGERLTMVREAVNEAKIAPSRYWIIPIRDMHVHMRWVAEVKGYTPKFDFVYSNDPLTRRLFFEAGYPVESIPFNKRQVYLATQIRKRILEDKPWAELVPDTVAKYISKIDGAGRLRDLAKTDRVGS